MRRIVIVGAGGHAQVVADILLRAHDFGVDDVPVAFVDADASLWGQRFLGLPVLGDEGELERTEHEAVIVGIGDNRIRARVFERLREAGRNVARAVHPHAVLAPDVEVGAGVVICAGVVVNTGSKLGDNSILNTGCTVDHHNLIGRHAHVAPGVHLAGAVQVGEGAFLGIGSCVIPGRSVGEWAMVGAGAAVVRDVAARTTVVGVPARPQAVSRRPQH
jgi:sugar O-acyltransferase (sialic acid O-acetyltransferase NeuD family)